ncbi:MAG TPA: 8-amino-7-oxononanoate synthase [Candidatus Sulfotelmatobacter sp.]|nr:8-amino-7-oxononanoate synthase [Candidatus Sulfotelmatobacter sp.]
MLEFINEELANLKKAGLYRELHVVDQRTHKIFCSNDYLGLSQHPKVKAAARAAIEEFGFGAGAARLISGNTALHEELEKKFARFEKREAAIVFPTGYMANLGAITALVDENDTVIIDRLDHASIVDACRLSKAKLQVYPHKDMTVLKKILEKAGKFRRRLIVTDTVFSMDGDLAPLAALSALAKEHDAILMTDDAHATGVLELNNPADIVMGTLSKAVGSVGGFVAGSAELIDYLRNKARSFIYTTALPPAACAASLAALEIIEREPSLREKLWNNIGYFGTRYLVPGTRNSPIIPLIIGDAEKTMRLSAQLFERGLFVSGIRPPTVPNGESRLRITISATHSKEDIECLASSLRELIPA